MTNLKQRLKELREISEKATPGEWYVAEVLGGPMQDNRQFIRSKEKTERSDIDHGIAEAFGGGGPRPKDATFIAASRTALPSLLDVVEALVEGLNGIMAHKGMCMMGPPSETCDEIISRNVDMADLVHRGHEIGSHNAYAECVAEARETLSRAEAHFAERGKA